MLGVDDTTSDDGAMDASPWPQTTILHIGTAIPRKTENISDTLYLEGRSRIGGGSTLSASAKEFTPGGAGKVLVAAKGEDQMGQCVQEESWHEATALADGITAKGSLGRDMERTIMTGTEDEKEEEICLHYLEEGQQLRENPTAEVDWTNDMYAEVQLQAELLEVMTESFPDCSPDSVQVALAKSDWVLDRASSALIVALQATCDTEQLSKPCRHLLNGGCFRKDCTFNHDFARMTCRYWLQGLCLNGDGCLFMHDLDVPSATGDTEQHSGVEADAIESPRQMKAAGADSPPPSALETHDFPSLVSNSSQAVIQRPTCSLSPVLASSASMLSSATNLSVKGLKNPSPSSCSESPLTSADGTVSRARAINRITNAEGVGSAAATVGRSVGGAQNEEDSLLAAAISEGSRGLVVRRKGGRGRKTRYSALSIQALMRTSPSRDGDGPGLPTSRRSAQNFPLSGNPGVPNGKESDLSFADVVGSPANHSNQHGGDGIPRGNGVVLPARSKREAGTATSVSGGGTERSLEWVPTGDAVATQYEAVRKEAADLARARNKCFMAATEAFQRGQGLIARDLARRGRDLNIKMKEKHRLAAGNIFNSRNPGDQVFTRRCMDLHGLHVAEAITVLDDQLAALSSKGLNSVRILTGSGHHSRGPTSKARLIPAMEKYCQSRGIPYQRVPDQGTGYVGIIDVSLVTLGKKNQTVSQVIR